MAEHNNGPAGASRNTEASFAAAAAKSWSLPQYIPGGVGANYANPDDDPIIQEAMDAQNRAK
jgi:hypothetical protein